MTYAAMNPHITLALKRSSSISPIRINEVSSVNDIYISDYQKKSDWIELYNTTDEPIDLTGSYLSDNPNKPQKYQLSTFNSQLSTLIIPPHGYSIVWCDDKEPISQLHAGFKLENADSAYISIHAADDSWSDSLWYQAQGRWQSYGRYPDGTDNLALFDRITIGQPNHINTHTVVSKPDWETDVKSVSLPQHRQIASIQYYNLAGQRISGPTDASIVIRRIVYDDGTVESKKMFK